MHEDVKQVYKIECPSCHNLMVSPRIRYEGGENDKGWIVFECSECKKKYEEYKASHPKGKKAPPSKYYIPVDNPMETSTMNGGRIIGSYDKDCQSIDNILNDFPDAQQLSYVMSSSTEQIMREVDCSSLKIKCKTYGCDLQEHARSVLKKEEKALSEISHIPQNMVCAYKHFSPRHIVIKIESVCQSCGEKIVFFFSREITCDSDLDLNCDKYQLIPSTDEICQNHLDGVKSKTECMHDLEMLLSRWNAIARQIFIVAPFIGTQYQDHEELQESWKWLVERTSPKKTKLVTRTTTLGDLKRIYENLGLDAEFMKKYELQPEIISGVTKRQNFHAKFYAGIIGNRVELLSGSFNLVGGPSFEQLSFNTMSVEDFKKSYMQPLNLEVDEKDSSAILVEKENDKFVCRPVKMASIFD